MYDLIQEEQKVVQTWSHQRIQTKPSYSSFPATQLEESSLQRQKEPKTRSKQ